METKKRLSRHEKRELAVRDILNEMFRIAGHPITYDDILGKDDWYQDWTMTVEQSEEWKKWGKKYLMKKLGMLAKQAEKEMMWMNLQWGLKYSDPENIGK